MAQFGKARVWTSRAGVRRPVNPALDRHDIDRAAQPVQRQAPGERFALGRLAVDQNIFAVLPQDEVEQRLALRSQQPGPLRRRGCHQRHILRDQPLQEAAYVFAGDAQQRAVRQPCSGTGFTHGEQVGAGDARRKRAI